MKSIRLMSIPLALLLSGGAPQVLAQTPVPGDCERDIAAFRRHEPGAKALRLSRCGAAGGQAIAEALRLSVQLTDTVRADDLRRAGSMIQDGNVLSSALELAGNRSATQVARTVALLVLLPQYAPGQAVGVPSWRSLLNERQQLIGCRGPSGEVRQGTPIPVNAARLIADATQSVISDRSSQVALRSIAECVRSAVREVPLRPAPGSVTARYRCDNEFVVSYTGATQMAMAASIEYAEASPPDRRVLTLARAGETTVRLSTNRSLQIFLDAEGVLSVPNGRRSCIAEAYRSMKRQVPVGIDTARILNPRPTGPKER